MDNNDISAKRWYSKLEPDRTPYLRRARDNSEVTQPQIYPPEGSTGFTTYRNTSQSLGSRGVNNLANKLTLSLFPPNQLFAKLQVPQGILDATGRSEGEMNKILYKIEKELKNEMEKSHLRPKLVELFKKEILGGSMILNIPDEGLPKIYSLEQFVIKRSKSGEVLKMVIKESITYNELAEDDQKAIFSTVDKAVIHEDKPLDMYTLIKLVGKDKFKVHQEINEVVLPGTEGEYNKRDLPFIFIPFVDRGEDYGRSYVEDYIGDLTVCDGLSLSMVQGAALSARFLYIINPNSTITPQDIESLPTGSAIIGERDSVQVVQADKSADMAVTESYLNTIRKDVAKSFLLDGSVQRDAERVTAAEVQQIQQELENAFGGIYATLANTLQEPLVRLYMRRLIKQKKFSEVLKDSLELDIMTGSAALGRGAEYQTLTTFVSTLFNSLGPETFSRYLVTNEFMDRLANSLGINTEGLIKTSSEIQAEMQAEQQAQLQQQAIGPAVQAQMQASAKK